jgi:FlaA1/EpsC-like NDP-sugar epimerase
VAIPEEKSAIMTERILSILLDGIAVNLAMLFSFLFRFLGQVPPDYWTTFWALALPYTLLCWLAFWAVGLYRRSPRFTSIADIWLVLAGTLVVCLFFGLFTIVVPLAAPYPRSIILFAAFITPNFAGGWRLALRILEDRRRPRKDLSSSGRSTLIVGAGEAGRHLAQLIKNDSQIDLRLLGFIDDDPRKAGDLIEGLPVLGCTRDIPEIVQQLKAEEILLAIPSSTVADRWRLLDMCLCSGAHVQTLGSLRETFEGGLKLSHLHEARLEDLVGSAEISLDHDAISSYISGQRVLITGAGGGAGGAIALQLAEYNPQMLILLGHGENSIYRIDQELGLRFPQLKHQIVIGDIRDLAKMEDIFNEYLPSVVFHAAAYKQVAYMEYFPDEAVKTNVIGTKNLALLADAYSVKRFIFLSTERAERPSSVTGATKRVAEEILQNASAKSKTLFLTVRFGNLLGSRGGLLETVDQQLRYGETVSITHPEMKREYLMAWEAAQLILQAGAISKGNEIIVLGIGRAFKVQDLVERYLQLQSKKLGKPVRFIYTGLRPGERLEDGEGTSQELEPTGWPGLLRMKPSSPLGMDFPVLLAQLEKEATDGTAEKVISILQRIVPTYEPQRDFALPRLVKSQRKSRRRSLGEIGIELGFINEESLQRAISRQQAMEGTGRKRLGEILLEEGDLAEVELRKILQRQEDEKPIEATGVLSATPTFSTVLPIVSPTRSQRYRQRLLPNRGRRHPNQGKICGHV